MYGNEVTCVTSSVFEQRLLPIQLYRADVGAEDLYAVGWTNVVPFSYPKWPHVTWACKTSSATGHIVLQKPPK